MIKPLFISLAPIGLVFTLIQGIHWAINGNWILGISMVLAAGPLALFLSYILIFKNLARTSKDFYSIQMTSLLGVIICLSLYFYQGNSDGNSALFSILSYIITLLYIYWYSENGRQKSEIIGLGKTLPDFSVFDSKGNLITAAQLRTKPTILMFTRGNWCPLCMAQIDEVVAAYKELDQMGVQVVIIASQPEKNTHALAARFDVPFLFLIDKDQKLGKQLGLIHHNGLPLGFQVFGHQSDQYYPTIIASDDSGTIIYSDQTSNYRVRPEPEELLKLFR
ncbi:MAG: peroxiredoxin family protein [Marinicella sp.]